MNWYHGHVKNTPKQTEGNLPNSKAILCEILGDSSWESQLLAWEDKLFRFSWQIFWRIFTLQNILESYCIVLELLNPPCNITFYTAFFFLMGAFSNISTFHVPEDDTWTLEQTDAWYPETIRLHPETKGPLLTQIHRFTCGSSKDEDRASCLGIPTGNSSNTTLPSPPTHPPCPQPLCRLPECLALV